MFARRPGGGTHLVEGPMAAGQWLAIMASIQSTPELLILSIQWPRLKQSELLGGVDLPNGILEFPVRSED